MGKKPAELQQGIEERRRRISRKMADLQSRIELDLDQALNAASEEASGVLQRVEDNLRLEERMDKSPITVLGGALGLGVLLGAASESISLGGNHQQSGGDDRGRSSSNGGSSPLAGALAGITSMASNTIGQELQEFVRSSLYGSERTSAQDGRAPESRPVPTDGGAT